MVGLLMTSKRTYAETYLQGLLLPVPLSPWWSTANACLCRRPSDTYTQVWLSLFSPRSWCTQNFVCALQEWSLFIPVLWKSCNQILLAFKVKFLGDSQSLGYIPRLKNLMWGLEPSQQCENLFGIIVLQFADHPTGGCRIWFYHDCDLPTVLSQLLLCPWMWAIFFSVGSSMFLWMVVQQLVVILVLWLEKVSTSPSTSLLYSDSSICSAILLKNYPEKLKFWVTIHCI